MITPTTLLLIGTVMTITGFIAGVLVMLVVNERRKNKPDSTAEKSRATLYQEVTRLWRDRTTGRLMVELDEKILAGNETLSPAQRAELAAAAREWLKWLGSPEAPMPQRSETAPVMPPPTAAPADLPAKTGGETSRPTSIVAQIDAILQEKLSASPLAERGIRLTEEPQHGVAVWVGLQRYAGIDSVPDAEIVRLIRAAVKEWERQNAAERS